MTGRSDTQDAFDDGVADRLMLGLPVNIADDVAAGVVESFRAG